MGPVPRAAIVAAIAMGLVGSATLAAEADDTQVVVEFPPNQSTSFEYGGQWAFHAIAQWVYSGSSADTSSTITPRITGTATPFPATVLINADSTNRTTTATFVAPQGASPLDVGTYSVDADFGSNYLGGDYSGTSTAPYVLTIIPAKVAIELTAVPDPAAPSKVDVSARMTGRIVDEIAQGISQASSPAGMWEFTVVTAKGQIIEQRRISTGTGETSASFTSAAIPADEVLFCSTTFTPEGNGSNFSFAESPKISFAGPTSTPTVPASETPKATATANSETIATASPIGLWGIVGVAAVLAILGFGIIMYRIRARKSRVDNRPLEPGSRDRAEEPSEDPV